MPILVNTDLTADLMTTPSLQCGVMIELIKLAHDIPELDRALMKYFWHFVNSDFMSNINIRPVVGDKNYSPPSDSDDYTEDLNLGPKDIALALQNVAHNDSISAIVNDNGINAAIFVDLAGIGVPVASTLGFENIKNMFQRASGFGQPQGSSLAIRTRDCNPFYQMTQLLISFDNIAQNRAMLKGSKNYWREFTTTVGSLGAPSEPQRMNVTRRGAWDIKSLAYMTYKIYQKSLMTSKFTGSEYGPSGASNTLRIHMSRARAILSHDFALAVKNNPLTSDDYSTPNVLNYRSVRGKLESEDLALRTSMAYINEFRLSDAKTELDKLVEGSSIPIIKSVLEKTDISGFEHELEMVRQLDSGQTKLAQFSKTRLLPNIKKPISDIDNNNLESLVSNSEIISVGTFNALMNLMNDEKLKNFDASEFDPKNSKLMAVGLPSGLIETIRFSTLNVSDPSLQYRTQPVLNPEAAFLNLKFEKNDVMIQGVAFEPITLIFDSGLFISPNGFDDCKFNKNSPSLSDKIIRNQIRFSIISGETKGVLDSPIGDANGDSKLEHGYVYEDILTHPRYTGLAVSQVHEMLLNCAISELLKKYVQIIIGIKITEEEFVISDHIRKQMVDAVLSVGSGITPSDLLEESRNISGINILIEQGSLSDLFIDDGVSSKINITDEINLRSIPLPADPLVSETIAVSQMQQLSQLLSSAFFKPKTLISEVITPKRFENIFFAIIDPDEFIVNETETSAGLIANLENIGVAKRSLIDNKLRIVRKETDSSSSNLNEFHVSLNIHNLPPEQ